MWGNGFIIFAFASLGVMTLLNPYLQVTGSEILRNSLIWGILGGFGLKAIPIINAVQGMIKTPGSS